MEKAHKAGWNELDAYINSLRETQPSRMVWGTIRDKKLSINSIDQLIKDGWEVWELELDATLGLCLDRIKKIFLKRNLEGYKRDKTLFHELVHAWYGDELKDVDGTYAKENNAIVEWLARQFRADTGLLRHAILSFDLRPYIYDRASHESFYPGQLSFQFVRYNATLMD